MFDWGSEFAFNSIKEIKGARQKLILLGWAKSECAAKIDCEKQTSTNLREIRYISNNAYLVIFKFLLSLILEHSKRKVYKGICTKYLKMNFNSFTYKLTVVENSAISSNSCISS